jgi:hypothetical protein
MGRYGYEYSCDECMCRCCSEGRENERYELCFRCWWNKTCENCDNYQCKCGAYSPNGVELSEYYCIEIGCKKLCKYKKGYATIWQQYRLCNDCYTNKLCNECELYPCICIKCEDCGISEANCDCCKKCLIKQDGMRFLTCGKCDKCADCCECGCFKCKKCQKKKKYKEMCNVCSNVCDDCCDCEKCKKCEKRIFKVQHDMHVNGYIFKQVKYEDLSESKKNDFCGCK